MGNNKGSTLSGSNNVLGPGDWLQSPLGFYTLKMNGPDLELAPKSGYSGVVQAWTSGTYSSPGPGAYCHFVNGDLRIYNSSSMVAADSQTGGNVGAGLALNDSGHIIIYNSTGTVLWDNGPLVPVRSASVTVATQAEAAAVVVVEFLETALRLLSRDLRPLVDRVAAARTDRAAYAQRNGADTTSQA
jgi:hypothetical protein